MLAAVLCQIGCSPPLNPRGAIDDGDSAIERAIPIESAIPIENVSVPPATCVCHLRVDWAATQFPPIAGFITEESSSPSDLGSTKITIWSDDPLGGSNVPVSAALGDQRLHLDMDQTGTLFVGYLAHTPAETDLLAVQVYGESYETGLSILNQRECMQEQLGRSRTTVDGDVERIRCQVILRAGVPAPRPADR